MGNDVSIFIQEGLSGFWRLPIAGINLGALLSADASFLLDLVKGEFLGIFEIADLLVEIFHGCSP